MTRHTRGAVTWQRLPYKAGKKILTVVALSVLSALSANGMIGQTPEEVEQEARRDKNTLSIDHGRCGSLPTLTVLYPAVGSISHTFGASGRAISFTMFNTGSQARPWTRLSHQDILNIQRTYNTRWYDRGVDVEDDGIHEWVSQDGMWMYLTYHKGSNFDSLMIIAAGANAELEGQSLLNQRRNRFRKASYSQRQRLIHTRI